MKRMSISLCLILVLLFISVELWAADWRILFKNDDRPVFYDAESIIYPAKDTGRIWLKATSEKYYYVFLNEVDCVGRKMRVLSFQTYLNDGQYLFSTSEITDWFFMIPGTNFEKIYKMVCK